MTTKERKALLKAGELIASKERSYICACLPDNIRLFDIEEAQLIDPGTEFWWGRGGWKVENYSTNTNRNARLIGIAMMLTMPSEILKHKCCKIK